MLGHEGTLQVGDRLRLSGGYDFEPEWLAGASHRDAAIVAFFNETDDREAAVVKFDEFLESPRGSGEFAVLLLRYVGAQWTDHEIVHIELCNFMPELKPWAERKQGAWIESHASYRKIG